MSEDKQSKNLFSSNSEIYSQGRPTHPPELFEYLTSLISGKELAWDVACGNGQAASQLSGVFEKVIATDMSPQQLKHAKKSPKIEYHVEAAEAPDSVLIKEKSVDLITIAVAIHWFPLNKFYERASKVLKPGGIIACWGYNYPRVNPNVDAVMLDLEDNYFKAYNPPEFKHVLSEYTEIDWPFKVPKNGHATIDGVDRSFNIKKSINLEQYCTYLRSRSSAQLYLEKEGKDAVDTIYKDLLRAWGGDPEEFLDIKWYIFLRVGSI